MPYNPFSPRRKARRAADIDQRMSADFPLGPGGLRLGTDPYMSQGVHRASLDRNLFLTIGRVVDVIAYANMYKVQLAGGLGTVRCCALTNNSLRITGPCEVNSYGPGDNVIVAYAFNNSYHFILGTIPDWLSAAAENYSDFVFQGSNTGLNADNAHKIPFLTTGDGGIINFSAGRPFDGIPGQEWGAVTEYGLRVILDSMMAQVAADEETGLFVFWWDQLTRLAGHNLQLRSAGHEREDLDDETEFSSIQGYTPYPWEALGCLDPETMPFAELTAEQVQLGAKHRSRYEPWADDQLSIFRELEFHGYLGQGGKKMIVAPSGSGIQRYSSQANLHGLADMNVGLDGSIFYRSAHSVFIGKTPFIPGVKRMQRPEAKSGDDTQTNYASCGLYGNGPTHQIQSLPDYDITADAVGEVATIIDQMMYAFNWKGLHPFHYHNKDWYVYNEATLATAYGVTSALVPFADLETKHSIDFAPDFDIKIDDRYGQVKYYANTAGFAVTNNGSISIFDGWGSEIRMSGGNIEIHAAGDLIFTSGRNFVVKAGNNSSIDAYKNAEIVASRGSLRIKSDVNTLISSGNSGCGGILLESRGSSVAFETETSPDDEDNFSGIVLRAPSSGYFANVAEMTIKTSGTVAINAEKNIVTKSQQFRRHLESCAIDYSSSGVIAEFWHDQVLFHPVTAVKSDLFVAEAITGGSYAVFVGEIYSDGVYQIDPGDQNTAMNYTQAIRDRDIDSTRTSSLSELSWMETEGKPQDIEFFFQSPKTQMAENFALVEPLWQQLARNTNQTLPTWQEAKVTAQNRGDTSPFPGYSVWFSDSNFGFNDFTFYKADQAAAQDRGPLYENPSMASFQWDVFEARWKVIKGI